MTEARYSWRSKRQARCRVRDTVHDTRPPSNQHESPPKHRNGSLDVQPGSCTAMPVRGKSPSRQPLESVGKSIGFRREDLGVSKIEGHCFGSPHSKDHYIFGTISRPLALETPASGWVKVGLMIHMGACRTQGP